MSLRLWLTPGTITASPGALRLLSASISGWTSSIATTWRSAAPCSSRQGRSRPSSACAGSNAQQALQERPGIGREQRLQLDAAGRPARDPRPGSPRWCARRRREGWARRGRPVRARSSHRPAGRRCQHHAVRAVLRDRRRRGQHQQAALAVAQQRRGVGLDLVVLHQLAVRGGDIADEIVPGEEPFLLLERAVRPRRRARRCRACRSAAWRCPPRPAVRRSVSGGRCVRAPADCCRRGRSGRCLPPARRPGLSAARSTAAAAGCRRGSRRRCPAKRTARCRVPVA